MSARPPLPPEHPADASTVDPSVERQSGDEQRLSQSAFVCGEVTYRTGDGPMMAIRPGAVQVEINEHDVTLGWEDGDSRLSALMPRSEYARFIGTGAIKPVVTHRPDEVGTADGAEAASSAQPELDKAQGKPGH
ncbi:hypothetical protein ACQ86G_17995 [Roseateles chitinivorans]|uniref:hypothetical protein n=1 Tax=Roseateles chitinivorans TaxID=2917965 RepID=UPI003D66725D